MTTRPDHLMIEEFARLIPPALLGESGKAFYTGRVAFSKPATIYFIGINPGGSTTVNHPTNKTVQQHTEEVLKHLPGDFCAFLDEDWAGQARNLKQRVPYLFDRIQQNIRHTPCSNLVFCRSPRADQLQDPETLQAMCWPFHAAVIEKLNPGLVICMGGQTGQYVMKQLGARDVVDELWETYTDRNWRSFAAVTPMGRIVAQITSASVVNWRDPRANPSDMLSRLLQRTRGENLA